MYQYDKRLDFHALGRERKRQREAKGWTQEYLAQLVDRTPRSIMYIENRATSQPQHICSTGHPLGGNRSRIAEMGGQRLRVEPSMLKGHDDTLCCRQVLQRIALQNHKIGGVSLCYPADGISIAITLMLHSQFLAKNNLWTADINKTNPFLDIFFW